jgi:hypothetical protein
LPNPVDEVVRENKELRSEVERLLAIDRKVDKQERDKHERLRHAAVADMLDAEFSKITLRIDELRVAAGIKAPPIDDACLGREETL